jgi:hypothetical protein
MIKVDNNPLRQPPSSLIHHVFGNIDGEKIDSYTVVTRQTRNMKLYLRNLALKTQQTPNLSHAPASCWICSSCGSIGVHHDDEYIKIMQLPNYNLSRDLLLVVLTTAAGCGKCAVASFPPPSHRMFKLTDQISCICQRIVNPAEVSDSVDIAPCQHNLL